jgi:hypothetical protein
MQVRTGQRKRQTSSIPGGIITAEAARGVCPKDLVTVAYNIPHMALVESNDVVQTFAADRSDKGVRRTDSAKGARFTTECEELDRTTRLALAADTDVRCSSD